MMKSDVPLVEARSISKYFTIKPGILARLLAHAKDTVVQLIQV